MIVIDSSTILAILLQEPEQHAFEGIIATADRCVISAVNAHETATVLRVRYGQAAVDRLWRFLLDSEIEVIPFDEAQVRRAPSHLTVTARVSIQRRGSIFQTALPTRSPRLLACPCSSKAMILPNRPAAVCVWSLTVSGPPVMANHSLTATG
jgi:uncharacterized protein with PIN domain